MRYKLRTLLIAVFVLAVLANAIASERKASKEVLQLDAAVLTALKKLNPEVSEYFDVDYLNVPDDGLSCYLFSGECVPPSAGSFLSGPRKVRRGIQVSDQTDIGLKIEAPWYYLWCGKPQIAIDFSPSRGNQWFAEKLEAELTTGIGAKPLVSIR